MVVWHTNIVGDGSYYFFVFGHRIFAYIFPSDSLVSLSVSAQWGVKRDHSGHGKEWSHCCCFAAWNEDHFYFNNVSLLSESYNIKEKQVTAHLFLARVTGTIEPDSAGWLCTGHQFITRPRTDKHSHLWTINRLHNQPDCICLDGERNMEKTHTNTVWT